MRPDLYAQGSSYHQRRRWTHAHSVRCLETAIDVLGMPESLLDVGCAEGVHVNWAVTHGIRAMGIDLAAPEDDPALLRADLRYPIDMGHRFDWVLCWEVAEHLPEEASSVLVDTVVRHMQPGGRVLFTAATTGQRGPGHINCQPSSYWRALFLERGLTQAVGVSSELRRRWLTCSPKTPWYGENVSVYWRPA